MILRAHSESTSEVDGNMSRGEPVEAIADSRSLE
jgi:hypothetical protein